MYTTFKYESLDGSTLLVDFLQDPNNTAYMCLTNCHFEMYGQMTDRSRMEANASWPVYAYYRGLVAQLEADVLGSTPTNFALFWGSILGSLMITPGIIQTQELQGRLRIRPVGTTEDLLMPVVIPPDGAPTMPRGGLSPSAGQMTVTFKSFRPYWVGATSNNNIWHV